MGNSDKTDKPAEDKIEAEAPKIDEIHDAVIIEDIPPEGDTPADSDADVERDNSVEADARDEEISESEQADEALDPETDVDDETSDLQEGSDDASDSASEEIVEETSAQAPAPVATSGDEPRKGGFVPLLIGGVIAGAIGFGVAVYFGDQLGLGANYDEDLAVLRQQIGDQDDLIAKLQSNQAKIGETANAARESASGVAGLSETANALGARVEEVADQVATLTQRLTDIEKRPLNEGLSAAAIAAYEREVEELKELVAAQKAEAAELKDNAALSAQAALARSAVTRIVAALDSGASYRAAIVDYGSATGKTVPDVLEAHADDGVITMAALLDAYPDHARAALAQARAEKVDEGKGNKLGEFLKSHLGARSVEPKEGTDTDAILSRVEAAMREGRLADGLAELDTLAEGPKSVMAEWRASAEIRLAATTAAEELAQSLNSN